MTVIIPFDWPKPPLSLNDRPGHPAKHNRAIQDVRRAGMLACRSRINRGDLTPGEPVVVTLVWFVPDLTRRDADNPVATLKPLCDGLVDAGLVPDDTPEWMDKRPVRIVYRKGEPGVELHIETRADVVERMAAAFYEHPENPMPDALTWREENRVTREQFIVAMSAALDAERNGLQVDRG